MHPYTKIDFVQRDLQVSRLTGTKYLDGRPQAALYKNKKSVEPTTTSILP